LNPWRGLDGLPREVWLLFATNLINRAGMMVLPFLIVYLTRELHFTAAQAGLAFALYGAAAIVAGPFAGWLSDRIGALPIMRASLLLSGSVLLLFPLARSRTAVYVVTVFWAACAELFRPASLAAITHVVSPEQRKPAYALNRLAINLGMSIGPALGGFLAAVSFRAMFVVDAVTTLISGVVLSLSTWRLPTGGPSNDTDASHERADARSLLRDQRLMIFLAATFLVGIVFFQHESALPLYMVQYLNYVPGVLRNALHDQYAPDRCARGSTQQSDGALAERVVTLCGVHAFRNRLWRARIRIVRDGHSRHRHTLDVRGNAVVPSDGCASG
jgi:predicted MFS family arabinose efflux permease